MQAQAYLHHFRSDSKYIVWTMGALLVLCTYHSMAAIQTLYAQTVLHFGDLQYLNEATL